MGNTLEKEYALPKESNASGGSGCMWKIYTGTRKSDGAPVSVWVIHKKSIADKTSPEERKTLEQLIEKGCSLWMKLKHPHVIEVYRPLIANKHFLAVETEPVFASLSNVMGNITNADDAKEIRETTLEDIDVQMGILDVAQAVTYLHGKANIVHRNVTPGNVLIAKNGSWKLAGFEFSIENHIDASSSIEKNIHSYATTMRTQSIPLKPRLAYVAPEVVMLSTIGPAADMFSIGCVIWEIFAKKPLFYVKKESIKEYQRTIEEISVSGCAMDNVPELLRPTLTLLLSIDPSPRPDATSLKSCPYLRTKLVRAMVYLRGIENKEVSSKVQFFQGLATIMDEMSQKTLRQRVLPSLAQQMRDPALLPPMLPCVRWLMSHLDDYAADGGTRSDHPNEILLTLHQCMQSPETTAKSHASLISLVPVVAKHSDGKQMEDIVMPFLFRGLSHKHPKVIDEALKMLADKRNVELMAKMERRIVVNGILPTLKAIAQTSAIQSHKARIVMILCELLRSYTLEEKEVEQMILPTLLTLQKDQEDASLLLRIANICELLSLGQEPCFSAAKILPIASCCMASKHLSETQFHQIYSSLTRMMENVRKGKVAQWKEAAAINEKHRSSSTRTINEQSSQCSNPFATMADTKAPDTAFTTSLSSTIHQHRVVGDDPFTTPIAAAPATSSSSSSSSRNASFQSLVEKQKSSANWKKTAPETPSLIRFEGPKEPANTGSMIGMARDEKESKAHEPWPSSSRSIGKQHDIMEPMMIPARSTTILPSGMLLPERPLHNPGMQSEKQDDFGAFASAPTGESLI